MSSIMKQIKPEHPELFALEFGKIAEYDFVYTLTSTNIDQSAPYLVTIYMTMRSWMSLIMVKSDSNIWSYLPLNKEKLFNLTLFTL